MAPRRFSSDQTRRAWQAQWEALLPWLAGLAPGRWADPSALPGWTVADLVAHFVLVADSVAALHPASRGTRALTTSQYVATYRDGAAAIDSRTRAIGEGGPAEVLSSLRSRVAAADDTLDQWGGTQDPVVVARRGPIRLGDFLATRCVELVVNADDLARSLPNDVPPPLERAALAVSSRLLTSALAERAPGRSVEVRVPPFAAVQCVAGPSHTRGTPPAVVEVDPVTFLRLATGRLGWAEASAEGAVRASGQRADLSAHLPVLG